jgi:hypothetical protein
VEKHAILDVMYYGPTVLKDIETKRFKTSFDLIKLYSDAQAIDSKMEKKMKILHFHLLEKYATFCKEAMEEGKESLKD